MKHISILPYKSTTLKNGSHPIVLKITKNRIRKYFSLNLSASVEQWNFEYAVFKKDKRLNPDYEKQNKYISIQVLKALEIIDEFNRNKIDWTLNQFEDAFLNRSKQGNVRCFFEKQIQNLKDTGHIGNAHCYKRTLDILAIFDKKLDQKVFSEIDIKYVRSFDTFLQMPRESVYISSKGNKRIVQRKGNSSNSRMIHFRTLRAVLNQAIEAKEASPATYPFGKGGFEVAKLAEETEKRYLPTEYLMKIKNTVSETKNNEYARKLFLFSYFCYGISFVDMAYLTPENIKRLENGLYIVYKRHKTKNSKGAKAINIKLTDELQTIIRELCEIKKSVENYLLPIITVKGLSGENLYNHLKTRLKKFNEYLDKLATEFEINDIDLTSYVSRHTMAMSLQNNEIPREVISQILGHKDLKTTNAYLDSFNSNVIDEAVKVL